MKKSVRVIEYSHKNRERGEKIEKTSYSAGRIYPAVHCFLYSRDYLHASVIRIAYGGLHDERGHSGGLRDRQNNRLFK